MIEGIFQPMPLIIILAIALTFFGPGKLPELGSSLGKAIKEFNILGKKSPSVRLA